MSANVIINLIANTGGLAKGMKDGEKIVGGFVGNIQRMAKMAQVAMTAITAAAPVVAAKWMYGFVKGGVDFIDTMTNETDALGIANEEFQALAYHARLAGVKQDELVGVLNKMFKEVEGGNEAFGELGLSIEELRKMDAIEMFTAIGDAIDKLPTQSAKAAKSMEIFGRSGAKFLTAFSGGRSKIMQNMDEFRLRDGGITREQAEAAKRASTATEKLSMAFESLYNVLIIKVSPLLEMFADLLQKNVGGHTEISKNALPGEGPWEAWATNIVDSFFGMFREGGTARQKALRELEIDRRNKEPYRYNTPQQTIDAINKASNDAKMRNVAGAGGAATRGSSEAFSILRAFEESGSRVQDRVVAEVKKLNAVVKKIEAAVSGVTAEAF